MADRNKRERFVALAEARVDKAVNSIRLIGNLSNRRNYEFSVEDSQQIIKALEIELKSLREKFDDTSGERIYRFKLKANDG